MSAAPQNMKSVMITWSSFLRKPRRALTVFMCLAFILSGLVALFFRPGHHFLGVQMSPPARAFYYWKTQWSSNSEIPLFLDKNHINKLYMRFFDVEWNHTSQSPQPVSPLDFKAPLPTKIEVIPVVYLTNAVFIKTPYAKVEDVADKVWGKVSRMANEQNIVIHQLQIDCDWSESSRKQYFHFADLLRRRLNPLGVLLSATIRLHQVKYASRTGIPPVDRGMLMFYNFGRIQADAPRSSIFNKQDAARYSSHIASYPMPLDLSLPVFSWIVHSRDGKVLALLDKMDTSEWANSGDFAQLSPHKFIAKKSFFFHGRYYVQDDLLLVEVTDPRLTSEAAELAVRGTAWMKSYQTVAFFDIDESVIKNYGDQEIEKIYRQF